jgi:large subunit ribosomal protein L10
MVKRKVFREKAIPEKKTKTVLELINLIEKSRSIVLVSIKNLPSSQFQSIKKNLRGKAVIKVTKKKVMGRAIDGIERGTVKNLKKYLQEDTAYIFSELDPFELSSIMSRNKSRTKAKTGQVIEEDVFIEPGVTELVPGPVISELTGLGIKFAIEDGKINLKEGKILVKAGEKVNEHAASIMSKLDMKPIAVGLEPLIAYDAKEDKIYENIKIDQEKTLEELRNSKVRALSLAVKLAYACKETIKFLLATALSEEKALEKFIKEENKENKQENIQGG